MKKEKEEKLRKENQKISDLLNRLLKQNRK